MHTIIERPFAERNEQFHIRHQSLMEKLESDSPGAEKIKREKAINAHLKNIQLTIWQEYYGKL